MELYLFLVYLSVNLLFVLLTAVMEEIVVIKSPTIRIHTGLFKAKIQSSKKPTSNNCVVILREAIIHFLAIPSLNLIDKPMLITINTEAINSCSFVRKI